jgi:hypothetical protein
MLLARAAAAKLPVVATACSIASEDGVKTSRGVIIAGSGHSNYLNDAINYAGLASPRSRPQ